MPPHQAQFCAFFQSQSQHLSDSNTKNLVDHFNHICLSSLNITAPLKVRPTSKASKQPWINDSIRSLKRECRKAERRWKKSNLQVHYLSLKDLLINYNNMVKDARTHYFSELITTHKHNPRFLFKTVDQLVNPIPPCASAGSNDDCELFLSYFTNKVVSIRARVGLREPTFKETWFRSLPPT